MAGSFLAVDSHVPNKPPYFDRTNYGYWRQRMQAYIEVTDVLMWKVIVNGPNAPAQAPVQQAQAQEGEIELTSALQMQ